MLHLLSGYSLSKHNWICFGTKNLDSVQFWNLDSSFRVEFNYLSIAFFWVYRTYQLVTLCLIIYSLSSSSCFVSFFSWIVFKFNELFSRAFIFPVTNYFIVLLEIWLTIKKLRLNSELITGLTAMNPAIGLKRTKGPHKIRSTINEKRNPIKHLSNRGIGSPITF